MANGHGGYRQPSNPAPVSNPGRESARTDRGPRQMDITGGSYGSGKEFQEQQSGAPLSGSPGQPGGGSAPMPVPMPTGLGEPSQNPDEPVTAGAAAGAGPSARDIGLDVDPDLDLAQKFGPILPVLRRMADSSTATAAFRRQVRELEARIIG